MSTELASIKDPLLTEFKLGHLKLRNRIFSSSHAPGYNTAGVPGERYVAYHEEKAKGGIALTMIGGSSNVSPDSASLWGQLYFGSDAIVEPLATLTERVHRHGTAVVCQITHMGRRNVSNDGDWLATIAPSAIREPMHRCWPKEMDKFDIRRVVADFAAAAIRARSGGLDGVELCATSHLIDQFWTPLANRRNDEYGGTLENRLRFTFEVLDGVREAIGNDIVVGIRMIVDEQQIGGLSRKESAEIAQRLAESGFIDFLNITSSSLATEEGLSKAIPPSGTPLTPFASLAGSVKELVDIPVLHATRMPDIASARHVLTSGLADLVGMTRAHIADPHIVAKLESGDQERIRVCVGASLCINRLHQGLDSVCIQNPATGRETQIPQLVPKNSAKAKKAVVVGAGPAGLEASRVLAERGHDVVLFEAQDRVGGQVVVAGRANEAQAELTGIIGWLKGEIDHLGVRVHLNYLVGIAEVLAEEPDIVIAATGGLPDFSFLDSGEDLVFSAWDVLSGNASVGGSVLVYDNHGAEQGPSVVEFLLGRSVNNIELVTPDRLIAQDLAATTGPVYLKMLYQNDIVMTPDHQLVRVERSKHGLRATLRNVHTRSEFQRSVDGVVSALGVVPNQQLYNSLRDNSSNSGVTDIEALIAGSPQPAMGNGFVLHRIGDAVAGRGIAAAIYDARRLCQTM